MSYTNELIDRFKREHGIDSDYAAAKALGLRPNRISNYRTNVSHADDKTAVMLAEHLGIDPFTVIARVNEDRATDRKDKSFWRKYSAAAALVICAITLLPPSVNAQENQPVTNDKFGALYIMSLEITARQHA